ncbi:MAG: hypothetical protein NTU44_16765 [Bacteroidetes bacterium]|nr:hypothetical protein [Bacteroidota bacterium]
MEAIFKLNINQVDKGFIDSIKKMFEKKDVIIRISTPEDETEYLLSSEANEKHILENMVAEPSVRFSADEFSKHTGQSL